MFDIDDYSKYLEKFFRKFLQHFRENAEKKGMRILFDNTRPKLIPYRLDQTEIISQIIGQIDNGEKMPARMEFILYIGSEKDDSHGKFYN